MAEDGADAKTGGRTWARTKDPLIKSQLLYQLSYASIRTGGGRTWARTKDPLIKSQLLYQLSYASVACAMGRIGLGPFRRWSGAFSEPWRRSKPYFYPGRK